jgi:hypothetical protein
VRFELSVASILLVLTIGWDILIPSLRRLLFGLEKVISNSNFDISSTKEVLIVLNV